MGDAASYVNCPQCGADRPHKNGRRSRQQLYKCRACQRQFGGGQYPSGNRFPDAVIVDALLQYYKGLTYRDVAALVMRQHGITDTNIAASTVMRWVSKYTDVAVKAVEGLKANVGDVWNFDFSVPNTSGTCWQVFDKGSGYLLATRYRGKNEKIDSPELICAAVAEVGAVPRVMYTRFGFQVRWRQQAVEEMKIKIPQIEFRESDEFEGPTPTIYWEKDGIFRARASIMKSGSRFKSEYSAKFNLKGWRASYNFIEGEWEDGTPPGLKVVAEPPFVSWIDVIALERRTRKRRQTGSLS